MTNFEPITLTPFSTEAPPQTSMKVRYAVLATSLIPLLAALIWFPFLPERIPAHWGATGQVTRFGGRWELLIVPTLFLLFSLFFGYAYRNKRLPEHQKIVVPAIAVINFVSLVLTLTFTWAAANWETRAGGELIGYPLILALLLSTMGLWVYPFLKTAADGEPNAISGYRTTRSMMNKRNWKFAQEAFGRYSIVSSVITTALVLAAAAVLFFSGNREMSIWWMLNGAAFGMWLLSMIIGMVIIEQRLKKMNYEDILSQGTVG